MNIILKVLLLGLFQKEHPLQMLELLLLLQLESLLLLLLADWVHAIYQSIIDSFKHKAALSGKGEY